MSKIYTREELTAITFEQWEKLSSAEQAEIRKQGTAFRELGIKEAKERA